MRKVVVHMQSTLDNRIANGQGLFWKPFPYGDEEMAYVNDAFRAADTWVMGRRIYEAVVPWWERVASGEVPEDLAEITPVFREFAEILSGMTKVVFSRTLAPAANRVVIRDDVAAQLAALKQRPGRDILLSCGPTALAALVATPGVIDEYLLVLHPAVIIDGPRLFSDLTTNLALRLVDSKVFDAGCVVLRYRTLQPTEEI
jgi:dihydrofolate reductase